MRPQQQESEQDKSLKVNDELAEETPKLSMLAELDDETGEGLLDEESDKTEEI